MPISLFWAFTASAAAIMAAFGRSAERGFIVVVLAGLGATLLIYNPQGPTDPIQLLAIDSVILAFSIFLIVKCDRYWPIWFAGYQALSVLTTIAHLISSNSLPQIFLNLSGFWFLPAIWCSALGVVLDWRARGGVVYSINQD